MAIKAKDKFYFKSIDSEICYTLQSHIIEAKEEGLEEVTLFEAIETKVEGIVWCGLLDVSLEKSECNKKECDSYNSISGRGVCSYRGKLYEHGEEVTFKISDYGN